MAKLLPVPALYWGKGAFETWANEQGAPPPGPVLVVHGAGGLDRYPAFAGYLQGQSAGPVYTRAMAYEPTDRDLDQWLAELRPKGITQVLAIGGGSVIDAAKAMASLLSVTGPSRGYLEGVGDRPAPATRLSFTVFPTTGGTGSEATNNAVISGEVPGKGHFKKSLRHFCLVPDVSVLEPEFMTGVPRAVSAASGMDALSQLMESHFSTQATDLSRRWTGLGLEHVARGLARVVEDPTDEDGRTSMALAAFCSGIGLANAGLGLVHGIAGTLGATIPIPHGVACARLYGPVFSRFFRDLQAADHPQLPEARRIAGLFLGRSVESLDEWINWTSGLPDRLEIPRAQNYGWKPEMIEPMVTKAQNRNSPLPLEPAEIAQILSEI
ncbi:MAG: iron-containing alcohol dehydrogenase [Spirochaetales bacterium]|nr:iron-containing alcohol dehydrogenase [Spirochaetales bacterium]